MADPRGPQRRMGLGTAMALVIASMVGTGVFTTTGLLVEQVRSAPAVLICWGVGGLAALCGALAYAELGAALPHNGGEYHFLSRLFHPVLGFLSAWVSLIVGFAAPLAALALAFGTYVAAVVPGTPTRLSGAVLIVLLSVVNSWRVAVGTRVQNLLTVGKVALIAAFIIAGALLGDADRIVSEQPAPLLSSVTSAGFAVGLLWVSFSYTGWNAAAYVAGEVIEPGRVLPLALAIGTAVVTVLYLALNAVFLMAAPLGQLAGKIEVGHVAAVQLLGASGGTVLSVVVALGLVSTVGAIIVTGPRVYEAVGADLPRLRWLARRSEGGGPGIAIGLQAALALVMLFSAGFEALLTYIGFTLSLFAGLTVCGVFVLRQRPHIQRPYAMLGYPVTPLLFLLLMLWMVAHAVIERPLVALVGGATVLAGLAAYWATGARRGSSDDGPAAPQRPGSSAAAAARAPDRYDGP